jgi:hypothetical protein
VGELGRTEEEQLATQQQAIPKQSDAGKLRATQSLVSYMGFVWRHPTLTLLEVAWRWLFGVPFLMVAWGQTQLILAQIPPSTAGLDRLDWTNPWLSSVILADAFGRYQPAVVVVLRWLLPAGVAGWAIVSGLGRTLVLSRIQALDPIPGVRFTLRKLPGMAMLQAFWMLALLGCLWLWYRGVGWASATHITVGAQPDLVGYLCWLIFLSLGIYVLWALVSWTLAMAPLLLFLDSSARPGASIRSLWGSFRLGKALSGKLMEISLVLAIVKIMLIVLDMVFSAAPLPFADEFGPDALHVLYVLVFVAFLIACDLFHVVRMRSFVALWRHYRNSDAHRTPEFASDVRIRKYADLQAEFSWRVLGIKGWFVSDESSLWDFTSEDSLEPYYARIREVYGIEVADIQGALLWKIFQRIARSR